MTQRPSDLQRLPTLTDVIEYDGEVMTVRSIGPLHGNRPEDTSTRAPAAGAGSDGLQAASAVAPGPAAAQAADETPPPMLELLLHQVGETLEPQLRAALAPVLEQIVQQAVDAARRSLAQAIREIDARVAAAASVSAPQRGSPPTDAAGLSA